MTIPTNPPINPSQAGGSPTVPSTKRTSKNISPPYTVKRRVAVLQLNAENINAKKVEIEKLIHATNSDVVLIQESHLTKNAKTPSFPGYNVLRKDRETARGSGQIRGGGLITLIKEGIQYSEDTTTKILADNDNTTEYQWVNIHASQKKQVSFINIYVPPISGKDGDTRQQNFDPSKLPHGEEIFICGDVNAHSSDWDKMNETDKLGKLWENWMEDEDMTAGNNGEPTFFNRRTGKLSGAPDVSIHHINWTNMLNWQVGLPIGSDHLPLRFCVPIAVKTPATRKTFWNFKKADWKLFGDVINGKIENWNCESCNAHELQKGLTEIIIQAAKQSIPLGSKKKFKPWWSKKCEEAIAVRENLRKDADKDEHHRKNFIKACQNCSTTINEAKREELNKFMSQLSLRTNPTEVWRTIHSLDGKKAKINQSTAIKTDNRVISDPKKKANAFSVEYQKVSSLKFTKEDRRISRESRRIPSCECSNRTPDSINICSPFTMNELRQALTELKTKSSPGADQIHNLMLKAIPESGQLMLLRLYNKCWKDNAYPKAWKLSIICPIPKPNKNPESPGSYRPIALTSCMGKLYERLVKTRIMWWLEKHLKLNPFQAGFRRLRSTADQCMRITDLVAKGFHSKKPPKRSILTLIDFSRAFDKVWHQKLYIKMQKMGIPACFVKWTKAFLSDRKAKVSFDNAYSKERCHKQGLPQGSVMSPTLFLLFINDITSDLPNNVHTSLYADDLAFLVSEPKIADAEETTNEALRKLESWSAENKMIIATEKCEVSLFTTHSKEAKMKLNVFLLGKMLNTNSTPKFLGITFDRLLNFGQHCNNIRQKLRQRVRSLCAISGKDWGANRNDLRTIHLAYIQSVANYCLAAWGPSASRSHTDKVQIELNRGARAITGCTRSTPINALLCESKLVPLRLQIQNHTGIAYEKAKRLPADNPIKSLVEEKFNYRPGLSTQPTWSKEGEHIVNTTNVKNLKRENLAVQNSFPPWSAITNISFRANLNQPIKRSDPDLIKKERTLKTLSEIPAADIEIWSDGSAQEANLNGGGGIVVRNNTCEPASDHKMSIATGAVTSSFKSELMALQAGLQYVCQNADWRKIKEIRCCTDSRSVVVCLQSGPTFQTTESGIQIWNTIGEILQHEGTHITLQWVPSHCGIQLNEVADGLAREGSKMVQLDVPVDLSTAKAAIQKRTRDLWSREVAEDDKCVLSSRAKWESEKHLKRREQIILAQLRAGGKCPILGAYLHDIGAADNDRCKFCNLERDDLTHMLISCPAHARKRDQILGLQVEESALWAKPVEVVRFLEAVKRI